MPYETAMSRLIRKTVGGIQLLGFSLAGEETVVAAPEFNVCFDIGRAPREVIPIDNLCLSHGHMDHAAGLAYYFSQRGFIGNAPGRVIVHHSLVAPLRRLMDVWREIEGHDSPGEIVGVDHLEDVSLRRDLLVRPFRVNHRGDALGFTLVETRKKLKPEFHGKTDRQLVALKNEGVEIEYSIECPRLTYTGDTAAGRFLDLPFIRESAVVILECTFFDREHIVRARAGKHVHVNDLPPMLEAIPDAKVVLIHLTRRTDMRTAKRTLARAVSPANLERITILMDLPPRNRKREDADRPPSGDQNAGAA